MPARKTISLFAFVLVWLSRPSDAQAPTAPAYVISTVAGNGQSGATPNAGDGGPAVNAQFYRPYGLAFGPDGSLFVSDENAGLVRKIDPKGIVRTYAGGGHGSDGGPALGASLVWPDGIAVDSAGTLYIADSFDNRVRKVTPDGYISTFAGRGNASVGTLGDGGPAAQAQLSSPKALALDQNGNLYVSDSSNNRIRQVSPDGGSIKTVAGNGACGHSGDGGLAVNAQICGSTGIALDQAGNLYFVDGSFVRKVSTDGKIATIAGSLLPGNSNGMATNQYFFQLGGIAVDSAGNVFIADSAGNAVWRAGPDGRIAIIAGGSYGYAGDGDLATKASIGSPQDLALDAAGNVFVSDYQYASVRKLTPIPSGAPIISLSDSNLYFSDSGQQNLYLASTNGAVPINTTIATDSGGNWLSVSASSSSTPATLSVTVNRAGLAAGTYTGTIAIASTVAFNPRIVSKIWLTVPAGPLAIATPTVPAAVAGQAYNLPLVATGGTPPYSWSLNSGALPTGLTLSASGVISGVPSATGAFNFVAYATDSSAIPQSAALPLTITVVAAAGPLTVTPAQLMLTAAQGAGATAALQVDGGPGGAVSITADQPWLLVNPTQGIPSFQTNVTASATGLSPGNYSGNVIFGGSLRVPVAFTVTTPPSAPHLVVTNVLAAGLNFQLSVGSPVPNPQTLSISSSDGSALSYAVNVNYPQGSSRQWVNLSARGGKTPGSLDVGVAITALGQTGNYTATLVLSTAGAPDLTIPLTLNYSQPAPSSLQVDVQTLSIASVGDVQRRSLSVSNPGSTLLFQVTTHTDDGNSWLTVTPPNASTANGQPAILQVTADPTGLKAGTYTGTIVIQAGSQSVAVSVVFAVTFAKALYTADKALNYTVGSNYTSFPAQPLELVASGSGPVTWQAQSPGWITVTPSSGQILPNTVATVQLAFDLSQLSLGDNQGVIAISSDAAGGTLAVPVDVQMLPPGISVLRVEPTGMAFVAPTLDTRQIQFVASSNRGILPSGNVPWLKVAEVAGASAPPAHTISVSIDPTQLPAGVAENRGTVTIQDPAGDSRTVSILVYVPATAGAACKPSKLISLYTSLLPAFQQAGGGATSTELVMIDDCGNPVSSGVVAGVLSNRDAQLNLRPLGNGRWKTTWHPVTPTPFVTISAIGSDPANGINPNVPVQALSSVVGAPTGPTLAPVNPFQTTAGVILPVMTPGMQVQLNGQNFVGSDGSAPTITLGGEPVQVVSVTGTQVVMVTPPDLAVNVESQLVVTTGDGVGVPEPVIVAPEWPSVVGLAGDRTVLLTGLGRSGRLAKVEGIPVLSVEKMPRGVWRVELERPLGKIPARKLRVVHSN